VVARQRAQQHREVAAAADQPPLRRPRLRERPRVERGQSRQHRGDVPRVDLGHARPGRAPPEERLVGEVVEHEPPHDPREAAEIRGQAASIPVARPGSVSGPWLA